MNKTFRQIKNDTGIESEKVEILADELDRIQELKATFASPGGKLLIASVTRNCQSSLQAIFAYDFKSGVEPLQQHVANYRANIQLLSEMQDITAEEEIARQLDEAVKEAATIIP